MEVKEIDTYLNTSENMKEVRKEDLWRNNHNSPVTKASDFTLHRVNDGDIAFKNGIKMESFSNASEILDITGNYCCSLSRIVVNCLSLVYNNNVYPWSEVE